jgi:hypothetical protein
MCLAHVPVRREVQQAVHLRGVRGWLFVATGIIRVGNRNQQLSLQLVFGSHSRIGQLIVNAELRMQRHALLR